MQILSNEYDGNMIADDVANKADSDRCDWGVADGHPLERFLAVTS